MENCTTCSWVFEMRAVRKPICIETRLVIYMVLCDLGVMPRSRNGIAPKPSSSPLSSFTTWKQRSSLITTLFLLLSHIILAFNSLFTGRYRQHGISSLSSQSHGSHHRRRFWRGLCFCSAVSEVWHECCSGGQVYREPREGKKCLVG